MAQHNQIEIKNNEAHEHHTHAMEHNHGHAGHHHHHEHLLPTRDGKLITVLIAAIIAVGAWSLLRLDAVIAAVRLALKGAGIGHCTIEAETTVHDCGHSGLD